MAMIRRAKGKIDSFTKESGTVEKNARYSSTEDQELDVQPEFLENSNQDEERDPHN